MEECSAAGPHDNWPLQKGFDRFYGFLQGETDQFHPELTYDNDHIDPPARPEDGYHVSEDLVDQAIEFVIATCESLRPDRPFFLYLAFGATHAPHQAPPSTWPSTGAASTRAGTSSASEWFARQLEMGIVPAGHRAGAAATPACRPWDDLTDNQQAFAARLQEAFAALLEHTDDQIGRLVDFLERIGELDNTLLHRAAPTTAPARRAGPTA